MVALARLCKYYTPQRLRHSCYAALVVYGLVLAGVHEQIDFQVCYRTGVRLLAGEALYRLSDGGMPFKYAPPVALFLAPLGLLPPVAAELLWTSLNAVALGYFFMAIGRDLRSLLPVPGWVVVVSVALSSEFMQHMFVLGQIDGIILALLAVFLRHNQQRPWLAAWALALATLIKLPYGIILLWALYERHYAQLWRVPACGVALLAAAVPVFGVSGTLAHLAAWHALLASTTTPLLCFRSNQSLWAMLCTATSLAPEHLWKLAIPLGGICLGAGLWASLSLRRQARTAREQALAGRMLLAWLLYSTALLSPLGWRTNLLSLAPMVMLALALAPTFSSRGARLVIYGGVALLAGAFFGLGREIVGAARFAVLMQYRSFGFGALLGMSTLLLGLTWGMRRLAAAGHAGAAPLPPSFPAPLEARNA
ncbi:MAG: glycosyltransferase family 87 protein [Candidatus Tectimicrobiota bacterium]